MTDNYKRIPMRGAGKAYPPISEQTYFEPTDAIEATNVQDAIEEIMVSPTFTGTVNATTGFSINGTQVVGAQGAAVANATADEASLATQLNALLARLRAHGLIAT